MNEEARGDLAAAYESAASLDALVAIGEGKAAVDMIRRLVNIERSRPASRPLTFFRLLVQYAGVLEGTDALAEADFIWNEALDIVEAEEIATREAVDAFLRHGLLMCKMHNYDGAVARLKAAMTRAEELEGIADLERQIILAKAWRAQAQAFEALGEFSQASNALDVLMNVKRQIRFIVFSPSRTH